MKTRRCWTTDRMNVPTDIKEEKRGEMPTAPGNTVIQTIWEKTRPCLLETDFQL
jgi:hypothetical protein